MLDHLGVAEPALLQIPERLRARLQRLVVVVHNLAEQHVRGRLRPHPDMLSRLAAALQVSADQLLGLEKAEKPAALNRRFLRRLQAVDQLPKRDQEALLRTIDAFLPASKAS